MCRRMWEMKNALLGPIKEEYGWMDFLFLVKSKVPTEKAMRFIWEKINEDK